MAIHKTAIISPKAEIAKNVEIGPYVIIEDNVKIDEGTKIDSFAVIREFTKIGKNCQIFPGAVLGSIPQDLKFEGEHSELVIGNNNIIREFATINRGTKAAGRTILGNNNLIMAYVHIAHDCIIGNNIVFSNCATLAGHVEISDNAIIGGMSGIHQFVKIGELAIVGGKTKIVQDIPPFVRVDGNPAKVYGLNSIGLSRKNMAPETKSNLKKCYTFLYKSGLNVTQAIEKIKNELELYKEVKTFLNFLENSDRGINTKEGEGENYI